jgi:hypothetical protein
LAAPRRSGAGDSSRPRDVWAVGRIVLLADRPPEHDFLASLIDGSKVFGGVSIVFCALIADEAFDDGVPPLRAYGLAVIALAAIVPVGDWFLAGLVGWQRFGAPTMAWWAQAMLFHVGLGLSIYAYWRVTQRAMRRAQAAETDRVRDEQRVQTARLLALQSRVEPQMLFDSLGRIGALRSGAGGRRQLLADLIALLRAMLPGAKADNSTVEREFALVEAWLRVTRNAAHGADRVRLRMTPVPDRSVSRRCCASAAASGAGIAVCNSTGMGLERQDCK